MMAFKDGIDHRPGSLNRVLTGEERSVTVHGVSQKPLVGRFLSWLLFNQGEFLLVADALLAGRFSSREGDGGVGEIGTAGSWGGSPSRVVEQACGAV